MMIFQQSGLGLLIQTLVKNNLKLQELQNTLHCINSLVRDLNNLN